VAQHLQVIEDETELLQKAVLIDSVKSFQQLLENNLD